MLISYFHRHLNRFNQTRFLCNVTCQIKLGDNLLCVPEITSGQEHNLNLFKNKRPRDGIVQHTRTITNISSYGTRARK